MAQAAADAMETGMPPEELIAHLPDEDPEPADPEAERYFFLKPVDEE